MKRFMPSIKTSRLATTLLAAAALLASCKQAKKTAETNETPQAQAEPAAPAGEAGNGTENKGQAIVYRMIVSFFSRGEGTDLKAGSDMQNLIHEYEQRTGITLKPTPVPWGREGEVDFCFMLAELDEKAQADFVAEMRERVGGSTLVQITENETCSHAR